MWSCYRSFRQFLGGTLAIAPLANRSITNSVSERIFTACVGVVKFNEHAEGEVRVEHLGEELLIYAGTRRYGCPLAKGDTWRDDCRLGRIEFYRIYPETP